MSKRKKYLIIIGSIIFILIFIYYILALNNKIIILENYIINGISVVKDTIGFSEDNPKNRVEIAGVKLGVGDVELNDNRNQIKSVRVVVRPIEENATRNWNANISLEQNGNVVAKYSSVKQLSFNSVSIPTHITLKTQYSSNWDPKFLNIGEYVVRIEIHSRETGELLNVIKRPISINQDVPKIQ